MNHQGQWEQIVLNNRVIIDHLHMLILAITVRVVNEGQTFKLLTQVGHALILLYDYHVGVGSLLLFWVTH